MSYSNLKDFSHDAGASADGGERSQTRPSDLHDLIDVLQANPGGLRRWSVMRAIRSRRERAGIELSLKFEDEIERVFRRHCADITGKDGRANIAKMDASAILFHRPKDKAGEVWAVNPDKASAWLMRQGKVN
ncbi:MAG TPA: hypothetical protein VGI20_00510 [Rhizomicrobium sp.]|jgi:hypothetical protein